MQYQRSAQLEKIFGIIRPIEEKLTPPSKGWIRAIRESLAMPLTAMAGRLNISSQSVHEIERRETAGTISINSLRDAAAALGCTLIYAVVPNTSIEAMLDANATAAADSILCTADNTMALEGQQTSAASMEEMRKTLVEQLKSEPKKIWRLLG